MYSNNKKIVIVGTGIVNLVSAYFLAKEHYDLILIDKAPSPFSNSHWKEQGCTFGGENVRMFSYTEADNYNEKDSQLYSKMDRAFENTIDQDGWLVRAKEMLSLPEQEWIQDFHSVNPEEARQFGEDIYTVNIRSGALWETWITEAQGLFEDLDFRRGILRIYSEAADFDVAKQLHSRLGSLVHVLDKEEALRKYPVFRKVNATGKLGGCMTAKGFTLKVQDLSKRIIWYLMAYGAKFRWNTTFSGVQRDQAGVVKGIIVDGELEQYGHYLLSLGAYAGTSLDTTQSNNLVHGVLGVWLTIPNVHPELNYSMKIHKAGHVGEDTNVTLIHQNGEPVLVLGSGYGYVGNLTENRIGNDELEGIYKSLKNTAQTYFPEAYEEGAATIDSTKRYCVRPWTPTSLGIFETLPALDNGKLIITGGNNTGGFTQSPYIADAVVSQLKDKTHPVHSLFHPKRGIRVLEEIPKVNG
ncbi:FAD-binding oxidoreductase [Rapidithrix thailandica]|uniref:FAD-binding oxidoreductase n=1 Tax=Rapidithrix thailandica TaxID=413964 RepID=A0AAW9SEZ3_9BACT